MVTKTRRAGNRKKPVGGRDVATRLTQLEKRVSKMPDANEPTISEVLRSFPDGIPGLAVATDKHPATLYDFQKGRNKRRFYPLQIGEAIVRAFKKRRCKPFGIEVTAAWLLAAWNAVPIKKKRR